MALPSDAPVDRWYQRPLAPALTIVLISGIAVLLNPAAPFRGMDYVEETRWECAQIAYSLYAGHGFASPFHGAQSGPTAWLPPIYPWILAAFYRLFGVYSLGAMLAIRSLNIALVALTAVLIYRIAERCFGRTYAITSAWTWALLPYVLLFAPGALTIPFDPSYLLLGWYFAVTSALLSLLFYLVVLNDQVSTSHWVLNGCAWGVAALANPIVLAFLPAATWFALRHSTVQRKHLFLTSTVFFVVVTPWMIRNSIVFHRPTFIRDNFGMELRAGNCEWCEGAWFPATYPALGAHETMRFVQLGESQFLRQETSKAFFFIRYQPARFATLTVRRVIYFWTGPPLSSSSRPALSGTRNSLFLLSSLLALAGVWRTYRTRNRYRSLFLGLLLVFPLVYYVTYTTEEYRIPIEPILLILATYALLRPESNTTAHDGAAHLP